MRDTKQIFKGIKVGFMYKDDSNAWYKADFKGIKVGFKGIEDDSNAWCKADF
jgi:hypothetical protein